MINYDASCAQKQMDMMENDMPQCFQNGEPKKFDTDDEKESQAEYPCLAHFQRMVSKHCNKKEEDELE